jgi:hypothetical protein
VLACVSCSFPQVKGSINTFNIIGKLAESISIA